MNSLMNGIHRLKCLGEGERGKQTSFQQGDLVFTRVNHFQAFNSHNF